MPRAINVWRLSSRKLLLYEAQRQRQDLTWDDVVWEDEELPLASGQGCDSQKLPTPVVSTYHHLGIARNGRPGNETHLKVVNSSPCYKELFEAQRQEGEDCDQNSHCDIHLITEEGHIPVHRAFLLNRSKFLDGLINENLRLSLGCTHKSFIGITLSGVKLDHLRAVVTLFYGGVSLINTENIEQVKDILRLLQIDERVVEQQQLATATKKPNFVRCFRVVPKGDHNANKETTVETQSTTGSTGGSSVGQRSNIPMPPHPPGSSSSLNTNNNPGGGDESLFPPEVQKVPPGTLIKTRREPRIQRNLDSPMEEELAPPQPGCSKSISQDQPHNHGTSFNANKEPPNTHLLDIQKVSPGTLLPLHKQPRIKRAALPSPKKSRSKQQGTGDEGEDSDVPGKNRRSRKSKYEEDNDYVPSTHAFNVEEEDLPDDFDAAESEPESSEVSSHTIQGESRSDAKSAEKEGSIPVAAGKRYPKRQRPQEGAYTHLNEGDGEFEHGRKLRGVKRKHPHVAGDASDQTNNPHAAGENNADELHKCAFCQSTFTSLDAFVGHLKEAMCARVYQGAYKFTARFCNTCSTSFRDLTPTEFIEHVRLCVCGSKQSLRTRRKTNSPVSTSQAPKPAAVTSAHPTASQPTIGSGSSSATRSRSNAAVANRNTELTPEIATLKSVLVNINSMNNDNVRTMQRRIKRHRSVARPPPPIDCPYVYQEDTSLNSAALNPQARAQPEPPAAPRELPAGRPGPVAARPEATAATRKPPAAPPLKPLTPSASADPQVSTAPPASSRNSSTSQPQPQSTTQPEFRVPRLLGPLSKRKSSLPSKEHNSSNSVNQKGNESTFSNSQVHTFSPQFSSTPTEILELGRKIKRTGVSCRPGPKSKTKRHLLYIPPAATVPEKPKEQPPPTDNVVPAIDRNEEPKELPTDQGTSTPQQRTQAVAAKLREKLNGTFNRKNYNVPRSLRQASSVDTVCTAHIKSDENQMGSNSSEMENPRTTVSTNAESPSEVPLTTASSQCSSTNDPVLDSVEMEMSRLFGEGEGDGSEMVQGSAGTPLGAKPSNEGNANHNQPRSQSATEAERQQVVLPASTSGSDETPNSKEMSCTHAAVVSAASLEDSVQPRRVRAITIPIPAANKVHAQPQVATQPAGEIRSPPGPKSRTLAITNLPVQPSHTVSKKPRIIPPAPILRNLTLPQSTRLPSTVISTPCSPQMPYRCTQAVSTYNQQNVGASPSVGPPPLTTHSRSTTLSSLRRQTIPPSYAAVPSTQPTSNAINLRILMPPPSALPPRYSATRATQPPPNRAQSSALVPYTGSPSTQPSTAYLNSLNQHETQQEQSESTALVVSPVPQPIRQYYAVGGSSYRVVNTQQNALTAPSRPATPTVGTFGGTSQALVVQPNSCVQYEQGFVPNQYLPSQMQYTRGNTPALAPQTIPTLMNRAIQPPPPPPTVPYATPHVQTQMDYQQQQQRAAYSLYQHQQALFYQQQTQQGAMDQVQRQQALVRQQQHSQAGPSQPPSITSTLISSQMTQTQVLSLEQQPMYNRNLATGGSRTVATPSMVTPTPNQMTAAPTTAAAQYSTDQLALDPATQSTASTQMHLTNDGSSFVSPQSAQPYTPLQLTSTPTATTVSHNANKSAHPSVGVIRLPVAQMNPLAINRPAIMPRETSSSQQPGGMSSSGGVTTTSPMISARRNPVVPSTPRNNNDSPITRQGGSLEQLKAEEPGATFFVGPQGKCIAEKKPTKCPVCGLSFRSEDSLKRHIEEGLC